LEVVIDYGGDFLDFMKKYGKMQKKGFRSTDLLRKEHTVHRVQTFFSNHRVYG
jgi:hypothetical protein